MTTYFQHPSPSMSGQHPAVSVPTEIYALLLSVYQLHDILLWGPLSGVYLPLVQKVRSSKGLRNDAQVFVPSSRRSATAPGNSANLGPKAPPSRPASMGPVQRKPPSGRRASTGVDESPAVPPPWWVLKARKRIIQRWRRIYPAELYPGKRCPLLRDLPDDRLRDLDNELQQKVEAFLAQKSTPPPPREEPRPDRQPRTPPRGKRTVFPAQKSTPPPPREESRPDRQPCTPALDALPARPDDVDNEPTDDAAAADPDGPSMPDMNPRPSGGASLGDTAPPPAHSAAPPAVLLPSSNKPMGRTTEESARAPQKDGKSLPVHDVDNEPTDDAAAADPDGSSMPDMNPRPSGGASLGNTVPPPAHSAAPPTVLLPSSNKPMGRTTEESARAPQKKEPCCALESHKETPARKTWPPKSCVSCGKNIPARLRFTKCHICDGPQYKRDLDGPMYKRAAPRKARIMHNSRSGPQHGHAEPKENLPKQGQHTRFPDDDATSFKNTRVPDNDATDDNLAGRCALTDTNRDLNTLSSSKPPMGSGPVDSPDLVPRNAKPSHDDISPVPDADSTSLVSPSVLLTSSQKKRLKKKKAIQAKAKLDAKAQCDSQRVSLNYVLSNMTLG